jgi:large subunit ribosomal protein L1
VEYKLDRTAIIHVPLGKVSFEEKMLVENLTAIMEAVVKAKPSGSKGQYVKSAYVTTTMGPSVKLDLSSAMALSAS